MKTIIVSDPCDCLCSWYSKEGDGEERHESIKSSYCDRDSKDLHVGAALIPRKVLSV